jgi:hypothetical protein
VSLGFYDIIITEKLIAVWFDFMKNKAVICYYLKDKKTLNLCGERNNTKDRGF